MSAEGAEPKTVQTETQTSKRKARSRKKGPDSSKSAPTDTPAAGLSLLRKCLAALRKEDAHPGMELPNGQIAAVFALEHLQNKRPRKSGKLSSSPLSENSMSMIE